MSFGYEDVKAACDRIGDHVRKTPLEESYYLGGSGRRYYFKLESFQRAKSFKIRGALNKMMTLTEEEKKRGVGTISSGNHGSSVSYAASLLGIDNAVVIVPEMTPASKIDKIRYFGGRVLVMGKNYDETHALGMRYIEDHGLNYIDAYYDDPLIYAGQGTIAAEILEQCHEIDTIVCPIGGGGLLTGVAVGAKGIRPDIRVVGVQTAACPSVIRSIEDGVCYEEYPIDDDTICDALVGGSGMLSYQMIPEYVDDLLVVTEPQIRRATAFMISEEKYVAEGGSCTVVAAVQNYADRIGGRNIALVISGGNIDADVIRRVLSE